MALSTMALVGAVALGAVYTSSQAAAEPEVEVWKSASCGCCTGWVKHMQAAGFAVKVHETEALRPVRAAHGVPERLSSCHTAVVDGYVIEGHVPAADVKRLLAERPAAKGLSAPGMPQDAPGMDLKTGQPYSVILFGTPNGTEQVYARH